MPYHPGHFRYHHFVCTADRCHLQSRGFEDDEDLFVRDIDTFDDLEAREPFDIGLAASVSLIIYNKYLLNADLWSYSKEFEFGEKMFTHKSGNDARRSPWTFRIHPRGFEDEEDLFERDIDAFYDLEAREPWNYKPIVSVFLTLYNKYHPLNADLRSYSKVVDKGKKYLTDPRTKKYAKRFGNFLNGVGIVQQIASFANSTFRH